MSENPESQNESTPEPEPLPPEAAQLVSRYRSYGWNWPIIAQLVGREIGTHLSTADIKRLCGEKNAANPQTAGVK